MDKVYCVFGLVKFDNNINVRVLMNVCSSAEIAESKILKHKEIHPDTTFIIELRFVETN